MNFPTQLLRCGRNQLPSKRILLFHYAFARHKPSHDWKEEDGLPDFSKIKIDQSFNWSQFSIPIWTRFNAAMEYQEEYAVVGYRVSTIRQTNKIQKQNRYSQFEFEDLTLDIKHEPIDTNYSHCELVSVIDLDKTKRREIRMTLKHNSNVCLKPHEKRNLIHLQFDYFKMRILQYVSKLISSLTGSHFSGLNEK